MRNPTLAEYRDLRMRQHNAQIATKRAQIATLDAQETELVLVQSCEFEGDAAGIAMIGESPAWVDKEGKAILATAPKEGK